MPNKRLLAVTTALSVAFTSGLVVTPTSTAQTGSTATDIILTPGTNEAQLNIAWRTPGLSLDPEFVQFAPTADLRDGAFPDNAVSVKSDRALGPRADYHNKAALVGLQANTEYSYRVGSEERGWSQVETFSTESFGDNWNFLFMGDPQLGAGNLPDDTEAWKKATSVATQAHPDSSFLFSGGDQVNIPFSYDEYDAFLSNPTLRDVPTAVISGNHDNGSANFDRAYNLPNEKNRDYYYEHNNALIIGLDSNRNSAIDIASHKNFLTSTIKEHGGDKDWIIVSFHHAPYSQATHRDDLATKNLREGLSDTMSELGVDAVLGGHDHIHTRSHLMKGQQPVVPEGSTGAVAVKPGAVLHPKDGETLYLTASSSTGSKFYSFMAKDGSKPEVSTEDSFAQNLPFDTTAWWNQDHTPDYTNVDVSAGELTFTTYNVEDGSQVDKVTLTKSPTDNPGLPEDPENSLESSSGSAESSSSSDANILAIVGGALGVGALLALIAGAANPQFRDQVMRLLPRI